MASREPPPRAVTGLGRPPGAQPPAPPAPQRATKRRLAFVGVLVAVLLLHAWVGQRLIEALPSFDDGPAVPRLQAAFVRALMPTAPPVVAAAAPPAAQRVAPKRPAADKAASAPEPERDAPAEPASAPASAAAATIAASAAEPMPAIAEAVASAPSDAASGASAAAASDASAPAVATAPADAASAAPFRWPASTRLSYVLTGNLRGEVHGTAQVEWIRSGPRYQVHLDITVGLPFAPTMSRNMTSDGLVTPQGLAPQRYDEATKIGFGDRRRNSVLFDAQTVRLADGRQVPSWPQVQDAASQFVQLVYLFRTGAIALQPGAQVAVPLALPRRVDRWVYDVIDNELLYTPFGQIQAWHLVPRPLPGTGVLSMEAWFAPSLQYLPVHIVIRRGSDDVIDLMIDRLPEQADDDEDAMQAPSGGSVGR